MKSFKQYITEKPAKLSAALPYKGAKWEDFRGLENPTERELVTHIKKSKFFSLRFIVDTKGKMWAWDANDALHDGVIYAMTGEKYVSGGYAKGQIGFINLDNDDEDVHKDGNLRIGVHNSRTVGTDFALKNRTMKALAKRINSKGDERVFWSDL
jgi:hypothetical protein